MPSVWPLSTLRCDSPNWLLPGQGQVSVRSGLVDGDGGALEEAWGVSVAEAPALYPFPLGSQAAPGT